MLRTVIAYGIALAAVAMFLQWVQYRHFIRMLPTEIYILVVALVFVAIGLWVGMRLTARRGDDDFVRNERAAASLGLTPRECDVLDQIATGASNKEIARAMGVSPNTIKTHIASIYGKLNVDKRIKAVDEARALSLIR